jgi:hypothetical protein
MLGPGPPKLPLKAEGERPTIYTEFVRAHGREEPSRWVCFSALQDALNLTLVAPKPSVRAPFVL